ncbi:MAG: hypothetical protein IT426_20505 [Pirellulales bacterium]|nr:hypothetical protein [Pirellulales bacterium]
MNTALKNLTIAFVLPCLCAAASAAEKTARVSAPTEIAPLRFAAKEIENALRSAGWSIAPNGEAALEISIKAPSGAEKTALKPESFQIEVAKNDRGAQAKITGGDVRGAMYGGLDAAERIRMKGPLALKPKSESPFLLMRAMKFNPPLKGNVYMSDEDQKNSVWFYDLEYWDRFLRTMAYDRYNALTFWSSHPYDQMVRLEKYPEATTLSQEQLDKNIAHFHKIFQLAKSYGLDTYLVTWNIHISPGFRAAYKVRDGQDSPLIRDYQKECIKELFREYPELTGMGTCPGENMPMSAAANAEWIRDVYLDTLAKLGRKSPFIYRYWGAQPKETAEMLVKEKFPGEILLDIKFNGEHMYSSTKPHPERMEWFTQPQRPYKFLWHLRNDCIFQLRWGDPGFARGVFENCGGAESGGFVMGSEIEIPGADRYHTPQTAAHRDWKYEFEKNWMRFAVWGRMGYDPKLSDEYWYGRFVERFGELGGRTAFHALQASSQIIPLTTSFHWNYMNGDWYPEGNVGNWNTSAGMKKRNVREAGIFHDIREWIFTNVIDDTMMNIPDYVATCIVKGEKAPESVLTPPKVAAMLSITASMIRMSIIDASEEIDKDNKEWQCTAMDLKASAALGHYYAAKIRAAVDLMAYLATGEEARKKAAVKNLETAKEHWKTLAEITKSHYVTHEVWLMGQFDWAKYLPAVEKDIEMAKNAKPWTREEITWTLPDGKKIASPVKWRVAGGPKEIEPWVKDFNARAQRPAAEIAIPAGSWLKTTLNADRTGISVIRLSAPGAKDIKTTNLRSFFQTADGENTLVAELRAGGNEFALRYETDSHAVPSLELENAPAAIFLEAEAGQLATPMQKAAWADATGGGVVFVPRGSGRGEKNGKPLDNGSATYDVDIPQDGKYRLRARVFWDNTSNNSLFYAWDGNEPQILGNDEEYGKWHWIETDPAELKAGKHTLVIRNRDENSVLDCMTVAPE